ncbi:MAG: hypothetical protein ABI444_09330, partial [Candidatus Kapaibacterium sp.]
RTCIERIPNIEVITHRHHQPIIKHLKLLLLILALVGVASGTYVCRISGNQTMSKSFSIVR